MTQISPLDRIFKRLGSAEKLPSGDPTQRIYFYVEGSRDVVEKLPLIRLFMKYRAYRLSLQEEIEWEGPTVVVRELETSRALHVKTCFQIAPEPGLEKRLVKALADGVSPTEQLGTMVTRWVHEFVRERRDAGIKLADIFDSEIDLLKERLIHRALETAGLRARCSLRIPGVPRPTEIQSGPFSVRVKDSPEKLALGFEAELRVIEDRQVAASMLFLDVAKLEEDLQDWVRGFFLEEVGLHEFHRELEQGLSLRLLEVLNPKLERYHRRLVFFRLSTTAEHPDLATVEVSHPVHCTIKGTSRQVDVYNTLRLRLEDEALFRRSEFSSLDTWYQMTLNEVIQDRLFERSYVDLVLDFDKDEAEIKVEVQRRANAVGYGVRHHLVLPSLEPIRIRDEGFDASCESNYATSDSRHEVGLELIVRGRIPDLKKIEHLLTPDTRLEPLLQESVRVVAQRLLHTVAPIRFYMHFKSEGENGESSLEEELRLAIVGELESKYHATEIRVIPKILVTSLLERIADLCKIPHAFNVSVEPLRAADGVMEVEFEGSFEILGPSERGWHKFLSKDFGTIEAEIEAVRKVLADDMRVKLATVPSRYLSYETWGDLRKLADRIFSKAALVVESTLGLQIRLISFGRLRTEAERLRGEVGVTAVPLTFIQSRGGAEEECPQGRDQAA